MSETSLQCSHGKVFSCSECGQSIAQYLQRADPNCPPPHWSSPDLTSDIYRAAVIETRRKLVEQVKATGRTLWSEAEVIALVGEGLP